MCPSNDPTNIIGHVLQLPPAMMERVGVGSGGGSCVVVAVAAVAEATMAAAVAQLSGSTIPVVHILHCAGSGGGWRAPFRCGAPRRSAPGGACGAQGGGGAWSTSLLPGGKLRAEPRLRPICAE
eukprot:gene13835-biopygen2027